jgi:hypothetical protein
MIMRLGFTGSPPFQSFQPSSNVKAFTTDRTTGFTIRFERATLYAALLTGFMRAEESLANRHCLRPSDSETHSEKRSMIEMYNSPLSAPLPYLATNLPIPSSSLNPIPTQILSPCAPIFSSPLPSRSSLPRPSQPTPVPMTGVPTIPLCAANSQTAANARTVRSTPNSARFPVTNSLSSLITADTNFYRILYSL